MYSMHWIEILKNLCWRQCFLCSNSHQKGLLKSLLKMMFSFWLNWHKIDWFSHLKMSSIYQELYLFSDNYLQNKKLHLFHLRGSQSICKLVRESFHFVVMWWYFNFPLLRSNFKIYGFWCIKISAKYMAFLFSNYIYLVTTISKPRDSLYSVIRCQTLVNYFLNNQVWDEHINMAAIMKVTK